MSTTQTQNHDKAMAFRQFHDNYRERLLCGMKSVVRNQEIAEDVTAKAFAIAFEKLHSFQNRSSLYTWVYRIALNAARNSYRRRRATVSLLDFGGNEAIALATPDRTLEALERSEDRARLQLALRQIPPVYRRVLVSHVVRLDSVKQIARQNRIQVGTVLSRIFKGKQLLREAWRSS